jgi:hypothetical protein
MQGLPFVKLIRLLDILLQQIGGTVIFIGRRR